MSYANRFRKAETIKLGDTIVNFSSMNRFQTSFDKIKYSNEMLFELLNPDNKYTKSTIFDKIMEYRNILPNGFDININDFYDLTLTEVYKNGKEKIKSTIEALKERVYGEDKILINKFRMALMKDLGCKNLIVVPAKKTLNVFDFYFDTNKDYSTKRLEGVKFKCDEGKIEFLNSESFILTVYVNFNFIFDTIKTNEFEITTNISLRDVIGSDVNALLLGAIVRDDNRIKMTERFMYLLTLLKEPDFEILNTLKYPYLGNSLKIKELIMKFRADHIEEYKEFELIPKDLTDPNNMEFKRFTKLLSQIDVNPLNLLSLIEMKDSDISQVVSAFVKTNIPSQYASSHYLKNATYENKTHSTIASFIMIGRLLPLMFYVGYYMQNGEKFNNINKIDSICEQIIHDEEFRLDYKCGEKALVTTHFNNDEFYKELRILFRNPLKCTNIIKQAIEETIHDSSLAKNDEDDDEEVKPYASNI